MQCPEHSSKGEIHKAQMSQKFPLSMNPWDHPLENKASNTLSVGIPGDAPELRDMLQNEDVVGKQLMEKVLVLPGPRDLELMLPTMTSGRGRVIKRPTVSSHWV